MASSVKTTVEIADRLAQEAKKIALREKTTLRALIEDGLRRIIEERAKEPFRLRDASFEGRGLQREFQEASWERIRDAAYEGHGD